MSPLLITVLVALASAIAAATWKAPRLTSVTLWACLATLALSFAVAKHLPALEGRVFWTIFLIPVIWVGFQLFVYWTRHKWTAPSVFVLMTAFCGGVIFLT